jgi:hypothetical protein
MWAPWAASVKALGDCIEVSGVGRDIVDPSPIWLKSLSHYRNRKNYLESSNGIGRALRAEATED